MSSSIELVGGPLLSLRPFIDSSGLLRVGGRQQLSNRRFNPLNAKIVAANFSCSAKVVFVKEKRWLCQGIEAPCNALVNVLRLYSNVYRPLTAIT